jgi:hypothetical protein
MEINSQIKDLLKAFNIEEADGISYLLSVYFNCRPSYTPTILIQKINATNILGIRNHRELVWNIPLFEKEEDDSKWAWVVEWNNSFGNINSKRKGSNKDCISRMKKFFSENPDVRKEEVLDATRMYFSSLSNKDYLTSSHYFIFKGSGKERISALGAWVETYRERVEEMPETDFQDLSTKMQ